MKLKGYQWIKTYMCLFLTYSCAWVLFSFCMLLLYGKSSVHCVSGKKENHVLNSVRVNDSFWFTFGFWNYSFKVWTSILNAILRTWELICVVPAAFHLWNAVFRKFALSSRCVRMKKELFLRQEWVCQSLSTDRSCDSGKYIMCHAC